MIHWSEVKFSMGIPLFRSGLNRLAAFAFPKRETAAAFGSGGGLPLRMED